jgi:hypothetical protein
MRWRSDGAIESLASVKNNSKNLSFGLALLVKNAIITFKQGKQPER